ncbi:MAG: glycosyl transferase family 1, partial [Ignavibacteriales bacterium]|nr:glycosyl transferase family 1 [Ignavibacteriales bacterium]
SLFEQALPAILTATSPRAWAFAIIGIHEYSLKFEGDRHASNVRDELAGRLLRLYQENRSDSWCWFEQELSYCNAVLPHALLTCTKTLPGKSMTDAGLESLAWLAKLQKSDEGHFVPIGSNGFYKNGGERARFDQQPIEAQAMASACLEAFKSTGDNQWNKEARRAFDWFLGRNDLSLTLYDPTTGGCRDGLHSDRLNENQGAESTLAFLQSLLELRLIEQSQLSMEAIPK